MIAGAATYPVNRWLIERRRTVTIAFREPPRRMFGDVAPHGPNELVFELREPGSISSSFLAKVPGPDMRHGPARLSFRYEDSFATSSQLEAYERLIHDAMLGDQTLFTRADGVERLWEVAAAVLDDPPPLHPYAPGSWGPDEARLLGAGRGTRARLSRPLVLARRPEGGSTTDRAFHVARGGDEECPGMLSVPCQTRPGQSRDMSL